MAKRTVILNPRNFPKFKHPVLDVERTDVYNKDNALCCEGGMNYDGLPANAKGESQLLMPEYRRKKVATAGGANQKAQRRRCARFSHKRSRRF